MAFQMIDSRGDRSTENWLAGESACPTKPEILARQSGALRFRLPTLRSEISSQLLTRGAAIQRLHLWWASRPMGTRSRPRFGNTLVTHAELLFLFVVRSAGAR